jgi:hypothetical protein
MGVIKCGFLNQFLIDKEDYRFRYVESSSLIGSIWILMVFFFAKYLFKSFTITSAMIPITKPEMNSPTIAGSFYYVMQPFNFVHENSLRLTAKQ